MYDDKSTYNGDWSGGLRHGHGEHVTAEGTVYRGMWVHDKPQGKGVLSIAGPQQNLRYTYSGKCVLNEKSLVCILYSGKFLRGACSCPAVNKRDGHF